MAVVFGYDRAYRWSPIEWRAFVDTLDPTYCTYEDYLGEKRSQKILERSYSTVLEPDEGPRFHAVGVGKNGRKKFQGDGVINVQEV